MAYHNGPRGYFRSNNPREEQQHREFHSGSGEDGKRQGFGYGYKECGIAERHPRGHHFGRQLQHETYYRDNDYRGQGSFSIASEQDRSMISPNAFIPQSNHEFGGWRNLSQKQMISHRGIIQNRGQGRRSQPRDRQRKHYDESMTTPSRGRGNPRRDVYRGRPNYDTKPRAEFHRIWEGSKAYVYRGKQHHHTQAGTRSDDRKHSLSALAKHYDHPTVVEFEVLSNVGHYSLDSNYCVHWNDNGIRWFTPGVCPCDANLFDGFDEAEFDHRQALIKEYKYGISQIIEWIKRNQTKLKEKPDFVVKHFLLKTVMYSPYERFNEWKMEAVLHKGTIYMSKLGNEKDETRNIQTKRIMYGGNHFEDLVTTKSNSTDGQDAHCKINRFYAVQHTNLVNLSHQQRRYSIVLSAEIDCIEPANPPPANLDFKNFVELKTAGDRDFDKCHHKPAIRWFKILDWWIHCKLSGAPRLGIGFRNSDGLLLDMIVCPSGDIPGTDAIKGHQNCVLNFLHEFLNFLQKTVTEEDTVYQASFSPKDYLIEINKLNTDDHPFLTILKDVGTIPSQ